MPRDSNGNYTLPNSVNPVVTGTTITATWGNTTMSDVAQSLTDSLDRYGRGGMLAPFKMFDGSITIPGQAFNNESTTGFSRPSSGVLAVSVLGSEKWRATSSGISITGTLSASGGWVGNFSAADLAATGNLSVAGTSTLTGAVAISIASADAKLTIGGVSAASNWLTLKDSGGNLYGALGIPAAGGLFSLQSPNVPLVLSAGGVDRLRIDNSSGFVGVGRTPFFRLDVQGATGPGIRYYDGTTEIALGTASNVGYVGTTNNQPLAFYLNLAERARLTSTGLGIGVTSPAAALHTVASESLRVQGDNSFVSWFNTANTQRSGYLQGNASSGLTLAADVGSISINAPVAANYNGLEIGFRDVPRVTGGVERGKAFATAASVAINTFPAGTCYTIYNDSASAITLTTGTANIRLAGTATTGNRTLAARGLATVWYNTTTEALVSGPGVS